MPLGGIFLAVRIRLQRHGRKKRPFYRLVAADVRAQRDGVFLERLGHYDPMTDPADVFIDEEKVLKWLRQGAQPSDTAKRLLSKNGILMKFEYEKLGKPMPESEVAEEVAKTEEVEPTETQDATSETDTSLDEATPDEKTPESAEEE
jgi:small subunit ribosomal protein S16